jgi:hypothetical protein
VFDHPKAAGPPEGVAVEFPIYLSHNWRVEYDRLQWILAVRKGRKNDKGTGWRGRSFCTTRTTLRRETLRHCGDIDPAALEVIDRLPAAHPFYSERHR